MMHQLLYLARRPIGRALSGLVASNSKLLYAVFDPVSVHPQTVFAGYVIRSQSVHLIYLSYPVYSTVDSWFHIMRTWLLSVYCWIVQYMVNHTYVYQPFISIISALYQPFTSYTCKVGHPAKPPVGQGPAFCSPSISPKKRAKKT